MKLLCSIDENKDTVNKEYVDNANVASATKLQTARTIAIGTGATGTATSFNGTANITIPITDVKDAYVTWGGKNLTDNNLSPGDMGCIDEFGHNKLAFLPASCIDVAYSTDGGTTWIDYGLTDSQKVAMVTTSFNGAVSGGSTAATSDNVTNHKLRIRLACGTTSGDLKIYTAAKKILFNVTDPGSNAKLHIRYRTIANYKSSTDTWTDISTDYDVRGGSGWNSIPFVYRFGGNMTSQTTQIGQFEFVFSNTQLGTWGNKKVSVCDIRLIGASNWTMPSEIARAGHLYNMDTDQNALFPGNIMPKVNNSKNLGSSSYKWANVYATTFTGNLTGTATKATGDKNGDDITTTYYKASNPNGYTSNTGTVTSITLQATGPIAIDSSAAITTSGTRTISHSNSGVAAGTYRSVTVNATGHVTAGTNPTTLSGYGITDAKIDNGVITLGSNTITPLTSFTETDPVFTASTAYNIDASDIEAWNAKQDILVSGENIKTINGFPITGSGNIVIGQGGAVLTDVEINNVSITGDGVANLSVDGVYNPSTNKLATQSTVRSAINAIDYITYAEESFTNPILNTTATVGVVTVGKNTNPIQLKMSNNIVKILLNNNDIVYIGADSLGKTRIYANNMNALQSITIGNFSWTKLSDGSIMFGGDE